MELDKLQSRGQATLSMILGAWLTASFKEGLLFVLDIQSERVFLFHYQKLCSLANDGLAEPQVQVAVYLDSVGDG